MFDNGLEADKRMSETKAQTPVPLEDVTYRIIGAAMHVHNQLGPGHKEVIYHRGLSLALDEAGLTYEDEKPISVILDDQWAGLLYLDYFVEGSVVVEEKALSHLLTDEEIAQVITYLAATEAPVGLLLNFGRSRLEYKRILPPRKFGEWRERAKRYAWRPKNVPPANPFIRSESAVEGPL
ncbi:MAG: GxxExxY protein [Dehalococcoidia bacterium]|nr:GxxExxY protein [Dehalococcoidia bacterium]